MLLPDPVGPVRSTAPPPAPAVTRPDAREQLLGVLARRGAVSRADLARATGLAPSTVTSVVAQLVEAGLVVARDPGRVPATGARGGRPATLVALHRSAGVAVGVDLGKRHVRVVVSDLAHDLLAEGGRELDADLPAAEGIGAVAGVLDALLEQAGVRRAEVVGVGMGIPGPVRGNGRLGDSTILPGWVGVRVAEAVGEALGMPVHVDNDSNLGALGEWTWGAASGSEQAVYLKVATGIGAGLIVNGRPYVGVDGTAGELGHTVLDPSGPTCRCGNRGCLEVLAGTAAVLAALRPMHGALTVRDVLALARQGDADCRRALAEAGHVIGQAVAVLCNLLNPERIVVGGELGAAGELLLPALRAALRSRALRSAADHVTVVQAALGERAEVLGALALALRRSTPLSERASSSRAVSARG